MYLNCMNATVQIKVIRELRSNVKRKQFIHVVGAEGKEESNQYNH